MSCLIWDKNSHIVLVHLPLNTNPTPLVWNNTTTLESGKEKVAHPNLQLIMLKRERGDVSKINSYFVNTCYCHSRFISNVFTNFSADEMKSLLYSRYYAEACNEWRGRSPRLSAWAHSSKETSHRWRAVDNIVLFDRPGNRTPDLTHR